MTVRVMVPSALLSYFVEEEKLDPADLNKLLEAVKKRDENE